MTSPMERTRKLLKERNIPNAIAERYHPKSKKYPFGCKQDLFNIIDLVALDGCVLGIQVCGSDYKSHVSKITGEEKANTIAWISQPGARFQIWSWRKYLKKRGGKAKIWKVRIADVLLVNGAIYVEERWRK